MISKADVAHAHTLSAIQGTAVGLDPIAIHLLVMACDEILETIARKKNLTVIADSNVYIVEGHQKEWRDAKRRAYNYFKHADRDADATLEKPDRDGLVFLNDVGILMNIANMSIIGLEVKIIYMHFFYSIGMAYPRLLKWSEIFSEHPQLKVMHDALLKRDRGTIMAALHLHLQREGLLPEAPLL